MFVCDSPATSYRIGALVKGRQPGSRGLLPRIDPPIGLERSMLAQIRKVQQTAAAGIRDIIIPRYQQKLVTDADESAFDAFRLLVGAMVRSASTQVSDLLKLEGARHTKVWMSSARKAFSVDLSAVVRDEDLESYLESASLRNASLIRGMADDLMKKVATQTTNSLIGGEPVSSLKTKLKHELEVSDARARLIARDQTSKLTSDLNRIRQEQAGVEEYIWRTSQDERVRERHRNLEGKQYKYGEPTGAEDGLPPGQPIQCRCIAQGVVVF